MPTEKELIIPPEWSHWCDDLMRKRLVMPIAEFDRLAFSELTKHLTKKEITEPMVRRGKKTDRNRGQNLCDWVKAHWTGHHQTLTIGRIVVWTERIGTCKGTALADWSELRRTLSELAGYVG